MALHEAERIGLVNKVVPEEELDKTADEFARKFLEKSSLSVKLCREAFYQSCDKAEFEGAMKIATELGIQDLGNRGRAGRAESIPGEKKTRLEE